MLTKQFYGNPNNFDTISQQKTNLRNKMNVSYVRTIFPV